MIPKYTRGGSDHRRGSERARPATRPLGVTWIGASGIDPGISGSSATATAGNYSRHLSGRKQGEPPPTLIDYFPDDFMLVVDESHQTIPQVRAMWGGDRARNETLVEYGFRPSAIDNRPLSFEEFEPTGLLDPEVIIRPVKGQVDDLIGVIHERTEKNERVMVTTLTKRMSEGI